MTEPLPIVVVGAGRVAQAVHLRELADLPGLLRVVAVIDADQERALLAARRHPGAVVCDDLAAAARAGARAALCCTPWWTHVEVLQACLAAGMPVLCEKPVSLDLTELSELTKSFAGSAAEVTAGYMKRHDPVVERFVDYCREHLADALRLSVNIEDPNAPHQVDHLLPFEPGPRISPPPAADAALRRTLGPHSTATQRELYSRGLGGSLVHQVNLVHSILAGSGLSLTGQLVHCTQWAERAAVAVSWRPSDRLIVDMHHLRVPAHRVYRERIEFVTSQQTATLQLPSPYARDEGGSLSISSWDGQLAVQTEHRAPAGRTGFRRQLERWAEAVQTGCYDGLPGLSDAERDLIALREAALALT